MTLQPYLIAGHAGWLEQVGEVELIGQWAEVGITEEFAASTKTHYQVFLTSHDAVFVFVQNRTPRSFEIHALSGQGCKLPRSICCAYRLVARCPPAASPDGP